MINYENVKKESEITEKNDIRKKTYQLSGKKSSSQMNVNMLKKKK